MIDLRYPVFQSAPRMYGPFSVFHARVYIVSVYVIDDVLLIHEVLSAGVSTTKFPFLLFITQYFKEDNFRYTNTFFV